MVALLALSRSRPVPRAELIDVLWPTDLPADPDESLSALLAKVRKAVGHDVLTGRRDLTLTLPDDAEIDVETAHAAVEAAETANAGGDPSAAWAAAQQAAAITGQGFLVGHHGPWVDEQREEIAELRLRALEAAAEAGVRLGGSRLPAAERFARSLVRDAPLRESGHRLLMEALAARGDVAEALTVYDRLRQLLRDELGLSPGERVREVHLRLLTGDTTKGAAESGAPAAPPTPEIGVPAAATPSTVPLPRPLARRQGTAFVGRAAEAERVLDRWDAIARTGCGPETVLLAGGPGIGKTRLASEVAQAVAERGGIVLHGGCEEDAVVGYQPFVEALRHLARHAPPAVAPGPGVGELAGLVPELAPLADNTASTGADDPETRRYFLFDAVAALLGGAGPHQPLLLVLDDLHWADHATLRLLRHVLRDDRLAHVLVLGTYRDAEVGPAHPLGELLGDLHRGGAFDRVAIDGLEAGAVAELIAEHSGQVVTPALGQAIRAETDGNPFFVGEIVRHLVETGVDLDAEGRAAHVARSPTGVPAGVKEVLELRLARLSEPTRTVLAAAAVLGREFRLDLLAATADVDEAAALSALEEALGARFISEQPGASAPRYAFVHALVRETLVEGLGVARAQRLHARAIAVLTAAPDLADDARIAALAVHSRLAGAAADPWKSIELSLQAGERARQLCAWDEALVHMEGALVVMERMEVEPVHRARLLVGLAELSVVTGDLSRHIAFLDRALALHEAAGDAERAAQVHSRLGVAHAHVDSIDGDHLDIPRAFTHFDAASAVLGQGPERTSRGHLDTGVAWALTYALDVDRGREAAARAMDFAERVGDELLWTSAAQPFGWHCVVAGDLGEGFAALEQSFETADRHRRSFLAWMATNTRGQLTWGLGAPAEARTYLARPLDLPYIGPTAFHQEMADGLGRCHASLGELAEARRELPDARAAWVSHALAPVLDIWDGKWDRVAALASRVLATSRRSGNRWDEWAAGDLAGRAHLALGAPDAAVASLTSALEIVTEGGATYFELWVRPDLARALTGAGSVEEAREQVDRCVEIVGAGEDWRGRAGIVAVADAIVLDHEGEIERAQRRFAEGEAVLRAHGLVLERADALGAWARSLQQAGDRDAADEKRRAAVSLLEEHGAGPDRVPAGLRPWPPRNVAAMNTTRHFHNTLAAGLSAAALLAGAPAAGAAGVTSCSLSQGVLTVDIRGTETTIDTASGAIIVHAGEARTCAGGQPNTRNTDAVRIVDHTDDPSTPAPLDGDTILRILRPAAYTPGRIAESDLGQKSEVEFVVNMNGGEDTLFAGGYHDNGAQRWTAGTFGVNWNDDIDPDLYGTFDEVVFVGSNADDIISAHGGKGTGDPLTASRVRMSGEHGDDQLIGSDGADVFDPGPGNDTVGGYRGNDFVSEGPGNDILAGGLGVDTISFIRVGRGVTADLRGVTTVEADGTNTITDFENVDGTDHDDTLTGTSGSNVMLATRGDDTLIGNGGADLLIGGEGADTASYVGASEGIVAELAQKRVKVGAKTDELEDIEHLTGSPYADGITGDALPNRLVGGGGADSIHGANGSDRIDLRDGATDAFVNCGDDGNPDTLLADRVGVDPVAADCETVEFLPEPPAPAAPQPTQGEAVGGDAVKPLPTTVDQPLAFELTGRTAQRVARQGFVTVKVVCPKVRCTATLSADGTTRRAQGQATTKLAAKPARVTLEAGRAKTVKLRLSTRALKALRSSRTSARWTVEAEAKDATGRRVIRRIQIRIERL